ncbi:MAG: glycosyltransferase [bacterium]
MKMPLNILHINTEKTWRGGERQAAFLISMLPTHEFNSIIAAPMHAPFAQKMVQSGKNVIDFNMRGEWDLIAAFKLKKIIKQHAVKLIHAHSSHALGIAALVKCMIPVTIIASRRVDFHLRKNIFSKWKYTRADRIIAVSDGIKQVLLSDGINEKYISVVKSGVRLNQHSEINTDTLKLKLSIPDDHKVVGIIGALAPHKDHHTFVESALKVIQICPKTTFLIVGEGGLKNEIEQHIRAKGMQSHIIMTGFRDDVMSIIQLLDIYVSSSYLEGLGTTTLDAMKFGIPVVATNVGGIPEIVEHDNTGYLVPPRNPSALADRIIELLRNTPRAYEMGKNGMTKVRDFNIEYTVKQTADIYRSLT